MIYWAVQGAIDQKWNWVKVKEKCMSGRKKATGTANTDVPVHFAITETLFKLLALFVLFCLLLCNVLYIYI